jgi:hypothetical protein
MKKTLCFVTLVAMLTLDGAVAAANSPQPFTTFMKDGGWCWYQDPRAIIHDGKVFIGSVKGGGDGQALIGIYDLETKQALGNITAQGAFDHDDHNAPVFYARPDGSVLATYAKHNRDRFHYSRISKPSHPMEWSEEFKHQRLSPNPKDKVTYMNLLAMKDEGKLYNFYRGIDFNPTFVTSPDHGKTWHQPVHFFKNEISGRHRPYARYVGNGKDTVYVSITDAHPRNYGNSIYYFEFGNGKYFKADGTLIKNLNTDGPLLPSEAELVYQGTGNPARGKNLSAIGAAWTSAIKLDKNAHPHIGYSLYQSNIDHRYRLATWNGSKWNDREVAFAGQALYDKESSYTGLITMDPVEPSIVFISTDVDPSTGESLGGLHEIYRAKIGDNDDISTIKWQAVTQDSAVRNIRPIVLREGDKRVVLWQRGRFTTYRDYNLNTVGFVEKID